MGDTKVDMTLKRSEKIHWGAVSATSITLVLGQSGFLTVSPAQARRLREVLADCLQRADGFKPAAHDEPQVVVKFVHREPE